MAAFKNEYKRNAGRVIRKVTDEMEVGYPFSKTMVRFWTPKKFKRKSIAVGQE
ncbi:hypothetical protein BGP_6474 [Beggiatoa sp. PS]|nr:hypothetical protein BGP_6474 [Beggiatoa sp. PS]